MPFLRKIPFLGALFRRDTIDTAKIDLLIFITAHVVKEDEFPPEVISKLEQKLDRDSKAVVNKKKRK